MNNPIRPFYVVEVIITPLDLIPAVVITNHEGEAAEANEEESERRRRKESLEPFHNLKVG